MRLYESMILSTLLYSAELWPLTATISRRSELFTTDGKEALGVSWKDKVTNEKVRAKTGHTHRAWKNILSEEDCASLVIYGRTTAQHIKHYTGRFQISREDRASQRQTGKDLQSTGLTWDEAEADLNRQEWRRSVASMWRPAESSSRSTA